MCPGLLAGVPCTSFSRAREGGPRAIRSKEFPMGLPHLLQRARDEPSPTRAKLKADQDLRNGHKLLKGNALLV
eukprot:3541771-Lingulodinium_polyedra.AAC.1